jgi:hypothetical protein
MLLPRFEKNPEMPLLELDFFAAFFLGTVASGGGVLATVAAGVEAAVEFATVVGAVTAAGAVLAVVALGVVSVVVNTTPARSGFGWAVPSTVAGVDVLDAGVTVPDVLEVDTLVEAVVTTGVVVPAGVSVEGVVVVGVGADGSFDSQSTVMVTPSTTALLEAATTVFCEVDCVVVVAGAAGVASKSVYSGKVYPGGIP